MFEGIPRNVWQHSPEYNIPPIPRLPRIPFPVPVFLVLYISIQLMTAAVTSNSLAKQSSFRESSFVLTQAEYRKLQRIVERKWSKRIFLIWNLQFLIHFLLSLFLSHENEMSVLWLAFNSHLAEITKAVVRRCYSKWVLLKISWGPATLLKRNSDIGVFLWNLRNF